ncbi:MAG: hypothetical protein JW744_05375 [Candidatus Diapherotrites archaeon]|uniref:Uncharacterized protein n=1 Tax=Candidatus Iainarchaeum sp. TaxID=3101447 RepID=A0A938YTL4_9ARCH|nr:hypothetical protein [Candidatus Diapherotrites archaeon]
MPDGKKFSANQLIVIAALFIMFFVLASALSAGRDIIQNLPFVGLFFSLPSPLPFPLGEILPSATSPMFFAMFVVSFFIVFSIVDWVNNYFKTGFALHPGFALLYFCLGLLAFAIALAWYNLNYSFLGGQKLLICFADCDNVINSLIEQGTLQQYLVVNFWQKLHGSAFMLFIWGGTFGWITRYAIEKIKL